MAETDFQRIPLCYTNDVLARHFRDRNDVYVSANQIPMIHCSAPRYTPQASAMPLRSPTTLRSENVCIVRTRVAVADAGSVSSGTKV